MTTATTAYPPTFSTPAGEVWTRIAAPLPPSAIHWRQDGKPLMRDGRFLARFVAYIDAQFVQERLDAAVPGEWDLELAELPVGASDDDAADVEYFIKATLRIRDVRRECIGSGRDWKSAATDAFKRAAVRYGVGAELYSYEHNWVQVDSDSKYAKPVQDPGVVYARRHGGASGGASGNTPLAAVATAQLAGAGAPAPTALPTALGGAPSHGAPAWATNGGTTTTPPCPKCGSAMWDNRTSKRNPKAPDYKCRDKGCDGAVWPGDAGRNLHQAFADETRAAQFEAEFPRALLDNPDDLPF